MKKLGSLALAALLVAALSVSASAASTSSAAQGTATIDGKKDDIYACDPLTVATVQDNSGNVAKPATGKVWTAWDANNLYVYAEITDAKVTKPEDVTTQWANDSVEVYVNFSGEEGAIADINAGQITIGPGFESVQGGGLYKTEQEANIKYAWTYTDTGYTVEMALPFGEFGAKVGATLGFSIGIDDDDDDDSTTREAHIFDGEGLDNAWQTADSNWGTLTLTDKVYEAPKAEAGEEGGSAATADAGIIAAVASLAASGAAVLSLKKRK